MTGATKQSDIAVLAYDGAQQSAVHGLTDLFLTANRISQQRVHRGTPPLRVSHWHLSPDSGQVERSYCSEKSEPTQQTAVIVPPCLGGASVEAFDPILLEWIRLQHKGGAVACSICVGAFTLAQAGLLQGRPATTHWALREQFSAKFPEVRLETEKLVIEDGDIITAGGVMAWVDLGLRLVDRLIGPTVMLELARFFLVDPSGREQRFYSTFAPQLGHGDEAILKVQHWLQANYDQPVNLEAMGAVAGLSERTFLRRFQSATDLKPTAYLQRLRVGKARELLELSTMPFNQVAWTVGYEDPGAFRKVFRRVMGLSPAEYRQRFAVR